MIGIRIGSRGSQLALWQARAAADALAAADAGPTEIVTITTTGDRQATARLSEIGGKGVFVKEIEEALLAGRIDAAVHSAKDLPAELAPGLALGAVLPREDPRDAVVLPDDRSSGPDPAAVTDATAAFRDAIGRLAPSARIGTASVRREAQLRRLLPSAAFWGIRGNLDTRLRKLDEGRADALIVAVAGMRRLGLERRITAPIPVDVCVPSPGQGTIAIQIRRDDRDVAEAVGRIDHAESHRRLAAERALVAGLGGGCHMPVGALATLDDARLHLRALVISVDGATIVEGAAEGPQDEGPRLGSNLAHRLLADGADRVLEDARQAT